MRVLVTGAAGFVGANIVRRLSESGHDVHAVGYLTSDRWRLSELDGVAFHDADLAAPGIASALVAEVTPQWIFHLAAHGGYSWQVESRRICEANLQATIELADAAERHDVQAFIHAGSSSEYGFKDHPADEQERLEPNSTYAVTKAAATAYCRHRARTGNLPAITLRLYSVYGELEDSRRLVATLLAEGLRGRLPPLVRPDTARDFVYVGDVCEAFILAAQRAEDLGGEIYNVGSGRQTTVREVVEQVRLLLEIKEQPDWGTHEQREWDSDCWCASTTRTARDLHWCARTDVESGLRRMLRAMSECPDRIGR